MEARSKAVEDQLQHASAAQEEADQRLAQYKDIVEKAQVDGRNIIKQSKYTADEKADDIIAQAKAEAADIVHNAEKKAEQEKAKAISDMKDQIAELAVLAASQIVEREINRDGEEKIINKIIEEAGAGKWQS